MTYPYRNKDFLEFMLIAQGEQKALSLEQMEEVNNALVQATEKQQLYLDRAQIYYQQAEQGIMNPNADRIDRRLEQVTEAVNRYEEMDREYTWSHRKDSVWYQRLEHIIENVDAHPIYEDLPIALVIRIVFNKINMPLVRVGLLTKIAQQMVQDVIENGIIH